LLTKQIIHYFFGVGIIVGIFVGGLLGVIAKYIIFGLTAILALVSAVPYLIAIFLTTLFTFTEKKQGLYWIVLLSRTIEVFSFIFLAFIMFKYFFL
jgi:hypothetical protein